MVVSQWREHGKKYGYWEFFEKQGRIKCLEQGGCVEGGGHDRLEGALTPLGEKLTENIQMDGLI